MFDLLGVGGAPTTDGVNVMSLVHRSADHRSRAGRCASRRRRHRQELGPRHLRRREPSAGPDPSQRRREADDYGKFIQVSRLGWPLVNEVIIPLQDKDKYNRSNPKDDVANFGAYILDPEVPKLLNAVLNAGCAATPAGGRLDIVGLLAPNGTTPADLLRININADQTNTQSHFPNGRALADDVTDTLLTVACNNGSPIGDGVNANDLPFTTDVPVPRVAARGNP